jgi:chromosome segregation ATPase
MNQSQNNGHVAADAYSTTETLCDARDTRISAERAAYSQLQQWNRLLERKLAERTQELDHSLMDLRSLAKALDTAEQRERTHLAASISRPRQGHSLRHGKCPLFEDRPPHDPATHESLERSL